MLRAFCTREEDRVLQALPSPMYQGWHRNKCAKETLGVAAMVSMARWDRRVVAASCFEQICFNFNATTILVKCSRAACW